MSKDNFEKIYARIGTVYYKRVVKPLQSKDLLEVLQEWSKEAIKEDHGNILQKLPKYDGFCCVPNHINFEQVIGNFYNEYEPFLHKPAPGTIENTMQFLKHIFNEQIELGLDYLTLLYLKPTVKLPILALVSEERNTGKTTFLKLLKAIFTNNMTINTNEDFKSNFNAHWATKLIIGVDETLLEKKEDSERLKNLATAPFFQLEAKGKNRREIEFFGKFVLCSNNEENFVIVEPKETRYWVRKIPTLPTDNEHFIDLLIAEIPALLDYLQKRKMTTTGVGSRMWFTPAQIKTEALEKLKKANRSSLERVLETEISEMLLTFNLDAIRLSYNDFKELLKNSNLRNVSSNQIKKVCDNWGVEISENTTTYKKYFWSGNGDNFVLDYSTGKARVFEFSREVFNLKLAKSENNEKTAEQLANEAFEPIEEKLPF